MNGLIYLICRSLMWRILVIIQLTFSVLSDAVESKVVYYFTSLFPNCCDFVVCI